MGKGIALMFKERFPDNFAAYAAACKRHEVDVGRMFVTASTDLARPRWIVNFPTKRHWRHPSQMQWIVDGLTDLTAVVTRLGIRSIAVPPLGSGNGGLNWTDVRPLIEAALGDVAGLDVVVFEPTPRYQNLGKGHGVEKLTVGRALVAEVIHRYGVLGFDCSLLEVQKLTWILTRTIRQQGLADPMKLNFVAGRYGPFTPQLTHMLDALDGSYLHCDRRLADARPFDAIHVDAERLPKLTAFLRTAAGAPFVAALDATDTLIDGFQSPLGMESLATVDWLLTHDEVTPTVTAVRRALARWPGGDGSAERKVTLFSDKLIAAAVGRLAPSSITA